MSVLRWMARPTDLHTEVVDGSLVVYDLQSDQVHCLDDEAAKVFAAATNLTSADIASLSGVPHTDDILRALHERGILTAEGSASDRRSFLKVAASGAAIGVFSIVAPTAAAAASGDATPTTTTAPSGGGGGSG